MFRRVTAVGINQCRCLFFRARIHDWAALDVHAVQTLTQAGLINPAVAPRLVQTLPLMLSPLVSKLDQLGKDMRNDGTSWSHGFRKYFQSSH